MTTSLPDILRPENNKSFLTGPLGSFADDLQLPLHQLFRQQAAKTPDAIACIAPAQNDAQITYRELDEQSDRLAEYIVQKFSNGVVDQVL